MTTIMRATPMEARSRPELPAEDGWWFEPKWDGFRCLAFRNGDRVGLLAKSGKSLNRFFPEVVERLLRIGADGFGLDGELLVRSGDGYDFGTLQQRLHPAESRIHKLSRETPATFVLFDMIVDVDGADLRGLPHAERRRRLSAFVDRFGDAGLTLSPGSADREQAQGWLDDGQREGVVAKRIDGLYVEGEREMVKVKRLRSADCVVGGFRYASAGDQVGSLLLGLYDEAGSLNHVGFTSAFAGLDKAALTRRLEALRGGPGFTGRAPGGPSRWSTERSAEWVPLQPEIVVEVAFDHVSDGRFRHGARLLRFRPDKAPIQCRMDQLTP